MIHDGDANMTEQEDVKSSERISIDEAVKNSDRHSPGDAKIPGSSERFELKGRLLMQTRNFKFDNINKLIEEVE